MIKNISASPDPTLSVLKILGGNPGRFAPDPVRPLDVSPQVVSPPPPPSRFAPGRFAPRRKINLFC